MMSQLKKIKVLAMDVDGVMTDGRIVYDGEGKELKFFDVQDGFGITLLNRTGIKSVIVTAKKSRIVKLRARDMKVARAYQGYSDKLKPFKKILKKFRVLPEEVCFIGDDLIDIPILKRAGFAVAVSNAVDEVKECVHHTTQKPGGRGAVREICEIILKSQGKWDEITRKYTT